MPWPRCSSRTGLPEARLGDAALEHVEERHLALHQLHPSGRRVEPGRAIDLRELLVPAGPGRPLESERVALDGRRIEVAFDRPRRDPLAARLADLAEVDGRTVGR